MGTYQLIFELLSAATFGRGDGVAGLVDREVEHDAYGVPYLRGRTLRGLLAEECANLLPHLEQVDRGSNWRNVAKQLFGTEGSSNAQIGSLRVGDATLPKDLVTAIRRAKWDQPKVFAPAAVLDALTAVRRQTSIDENGTPSDGSLRSMRVVLRGTVFMADLALPDPEDELELALLGACVLAWRRAGTGRNRGRGRVRAQLLNGQGQDVQQAYFDLIKQRLFAAAPKEVQP